MQVGAFADGPELVNNSVPESGAANYRGRSGGMAVYKRGGKGTTLVGEYNAEINLAASFNSGSDGKISGKIDKIDLYRATATPDGKYYTAGEGQRVDYEIVLGDAPIFPGTGRFRGTSVTVNSGTGVNSTPISPSSGRWGGRFSNVDTSSQPRAVGGTVGVQWTESDGSEGNLIGAFGALHEDIWP